MDERKRDSMIAYIRRRMEEVGITPTDLAAAMAGEQLQHTELRYRSATGDTWSGEGEMPQWLQQAISAGQSIEHFEVSLTEKPQRKNREKADWRDDPFAGSPLARSPRQS
ncbi:H-NS histone family protein [Paraburkholderia humisilvae]|uniref:DNA-binding protein H-NS-like C-terminal domain-containing protein n=1 Tax=Paraburkholderia humisilvae TaxID=627669 RepID=A0A6J5F8K4_9BURK|nr:H-NS histone family protein [Paraburkholderia humisilvae]CAB3775180.1 hypothetical protein LMG29542_08562 [Paraburkholderia humisilvae]